MWDFRLLLFIFGPSQIKQGEILSAFPCFSHFKKYHYFVTLPNRHLCKIFTCYFWAIVIISVEVLVPSQYYCLPISFHISIVFSLHCESYGRQYVGQVWTIYGHDRTSVIANWSMGQLFKILKLLIKKEYLLFYQGTRKVLKQCYNIQIYGTMRWSL